MGFNIKPVYGMLRGYAWNCEEIAEEESYSSFFVLFKRNSETEFAKSKVVQIDSRMYADIYEECVELFNSLVNEKIEWFIKRTEKTKKDLISE